MLNEKLKGDIIMNFEVVDYDYVPDDKKWWFELKNESGKQLIYETTGISPDFKVYQHEKRKNIVYGIKDNEKTDIGEKLSVFLGMKKDLFNFAKFEQNLIDEIKKTIFKIEIWHKWPSETCYENGVEFERDEYDVNFRYDGGNSECIKEFSSLEEALREIKENDHFYYTRCFKNEQASSLKRTLFDLDYYVVAIAEYEGEDFVQTWEELVIGEQDLAPLSKSWHELLHEDNSDLWRVTTENGCVYTIHAENREQAEKIAKVPHGSKSIEYVGDYASIADDVSKKSYFQQVQNNR